MGYPTTQDARGSRTEQQFVIVSDALRAHGVRRGDVATVAPGPAQPGELVAAAGTCPRRIGQAAIGVLHCGGGIAPQTGAADPFRCCETLEILGRLTVLEREVDWLETDVALAQMDW